MKLVFWLCILVVMLNLLLGDARIGFTLAVFWEHLNTVRLAMILIGASLLTMILMNLLFSDFSNHVLPRPPDMPPSEEPTPKTEG
jgi:hypothetical protein